MALSRSNVRPHNVFDKLAECQRDLKCVVTDNYAESAKITALLNKLPEDVALEVGELIYSIILQHEKKATHGCSFKQIAHDGEPLSETGVGLKYDTRRLPPPLLQMLYILVSQLNSGEFPFFRD